MGETLVDGEGWLQGAEDRAAIGRGGEGDGNAGGRGEAEAVDAELVAVTEVRIGAVGPTKIACDGLAGDDDGGRGGINGSEVAAGVGEVSEEGAGTEKERGSHQGNGLEGHGELVIGDWNFSVNDQGAAAPRRTAPET